MIRLRLFSFDDPSHQIDARIIGADPTTIGRDSSADWVIHDPERALSRKHCTVRATGVGVSVLDTSANGTFVDDRGERIASDANTLVAPGESIRIGNYRLIVEALSADPQPSARAPDPTSNLFAPPRGLDPVDPPQRRARIDPFASQLLPDPLLADHRPAQRAPLADEDAWDARPAPRAGDWVQSQKHQAGHENLIGTMREWAEPPRPDADAGFGFDAPFARPIMVASPATAADVAIPADWDEVVAPVPPALTASFPLPELAATTPVHVASPAITATMPALATATPTSAPPPPEVAAVLTLASASAQPRSVVQPTPVAASMPLMPVTPAMAGPIAPALSPVPVVAPPAQVSANLPAAASSAPLPASVAAHQDGALFDAFCVGARLNSTAFAGEDRAAVMNKLGEVYRAMVLGLTDLMGERTALKNEYRMTRTMVRPESNNPFKWMPPQRLAVEVLRHGEPGFASGPEAVTEGFRDIKVHLLCMLAGLRASIGATMDALSPAAAEAQVEGRFLIKAQRDAALWAEYRELYERFCNEADSSADGAINRAFREAYERQLGQLLDVGGGSSGYSATGSRH